MILNSYAWIYILGNVFMTYVFYLYFQVFFSKRIVNRVVEAAAYIAFFALTTILYFNTRVPAIMLVSNIILLMGISCLYESTVSKKIISVAIMYATLVCIETAIVVLSNYTELSLHLPSGFDSIFGIIAIRVTSFAFVLFVRKFTHLKQNVLVPTTYWLSVFLVPFCTLVQFFIILSNPVSEWLLVSTICCVFVVNITTFYLYDRISFMMTEQMNKRILLEQQKYYDHQLCMMKDTLSATKQIKHDLKNKLSPIYELACTGNKEELVACLSELIDVCCTTKDYVSTGNVTIDSILNYKLSQAEKYGATLSSEFIVPSELKINSLDLAAILGNLIDNAVEAIQRINESDRWIDIKAKYTKGRLIITVANSYDGKIIKENGNLRTCKTDHTEHGIGLASVRSILKKYDGVIELEYNNDTFKSKVFVYA